MILHIDMDAFYASVEERDRPELKGRPVIVGGTAQRGVVCAANYVARQFGVHSAMPSVTAARLCPHAVFLHGRMDYYAQISQQIRSIFERFTPLVEPLSLDEAFLDVHGSVGLYGDPATIGRQIKQQIREELGLVASVGVAPNKFLAKIASDLKKPDGFVVVPPDGVEAFLDPLPIGRLWGVGARAEARLRSLGAATIGQLRRVPAAQLQKEFGQQGAHLAELARGIDPRRVVPDREAKSISHETTFPVDIEDTDVLLAWLLELSEQVGRRLRRHALRGRRVVIKVRFADFQTITRSRTLDAATDRTQELWTEARELFVQRLPRPRPPVRLLGMGMAELQASGKQQLSLFDGQQQQKQSAVDMVGDLLRERFGRAAVRRGSTLAHEAEHRPVPRPNEST